MQINSLGQLPLQVGPLALDYRIKTPPAKFAEIRWGYNSGAVRKDNHVNVEFQNLENIHLYPISDERFILAHLADPEGPRQGSKVLTSWLFEAAQDGFALAEHIRLNEFCLPRTGRYTEDELYEMLKPTYATILKKNLGLTPKRYGSLFMTPIAAKWDDINFFNNSGVLVGSDPDEYIHWLFSNEPMEVSGSDAKLARSKEATPYTVEGCYAEFNGELHLKGRPLCMLHGKVSLQLASGILVSSMGTRVEIPGVSLIEFSSVLTPLMTK